MAEQILTQVEVDALLKGLSNGEIKTESHSPVDNEGDIRPYDFQNQDRGLRGRMYALEMISEKFCRSIRGAMFNIIRRKTVDVSFEGVKTMRYEEFLKNLQVPSSLNVFQAPPLRGQCVLAIDPSLVYVMVDSYFGGDCRFYTRIEGRDFTNVEQGLIKKVADVMFHEMAEIWRPVYHLAFKFVRAEMNPQFVNIAGQNDVVVVLTFKMEIENTVDRFFFCMPFSTIETIKERLYGMQRVDSDGSDKNWSEGLMAQFCQVQLSLSAEVGRADINVSDLLNLKAGDIIQLSKKIKDPLAVSIEGIQKFTARPGVMDGNYAVKIFSEIKEGGKTV